MSVKNLITKTKIRIIRISTVPISLNILLKGQLNFLNNYFEIIGISSSGKDLEDTALREGIKTYSINMERNISLIRDFISFILLMRLFLTLKPQIVHSITPKAGLLSMAAGYFTKVPVRMHTFTGLIFPTRTGFSHWLLKNMDRLTCRFATYVIPEGEGVKRDLIRYKITNKTLNVIGNGNVNGVNTTYFSKVSVSNEVLQQTREMWQIKPEDFVYIFVGRLVKDKGINELVAAFKQIQTKKQDVKLILVGPFEPELDPLQELTLNEIKTNPGIITTGFQEDVRPYYSISHCLVFPSYREGFPNVVMQAGAMGLPSVVTDINGCNEIIEPEHNGLIIPTKNTKALEEAMLRIVEESTLTKKLASNARESILSRFDQGTIWKLIKEEYDKQLNKFNCS